MGLFRNKINNYSELSTELKESNVNFDKIYDDCVEHFTTVKAGDLNKWKRKIKSTEEFRKSVKRFFTGKGLKDKEAEELTDRFIKSTEGYQILEELINDESISDIKVLSFNNIRVKRNGERESTDIKFENNDDYKKFVKMVAATNEINLSRINAKQTFTDKDSNAKFRLRFTINTEHINSNELPLIHVRKHPKKKYTKEHLLMLTFIYYFKNILSISDIQVLLGPLTEKYFNKDGEMNLTEIYEEIMRLELKQIDPLTKDIVRKYKMACDSYENAEEENQDFLKKFAFICMLSFDVYVKKQVIEKLIDDMADSHK